MKRRLRLLGVALGCACWLGPLGQAQAEETAAAPSGDAAGAKDIVRLKNGGLVRGTIGELMPGESVTITTTAGKTREFPMAEVDYAGPADKDPTAGAEPATAAQAAPATKTARPYVTVKGEIARLHLVSDPVGLTFHRKSGSATSGEVQAAGFDRLCTAPCDIEIPAGTEELSLSKPDKDPNKPKSVTLPAGDSELVGTYESNAGARIAGFILMIGGAGLGTFLLIKSLPSDGDDGVNTGLLIPAVALTVGGSIGGAVLMMQKDSSSFEVRRKDAAELSWPRSQQLVLSGKL